MVKINITTYTGPFTPPVVGTLSGVMLDTAAANPNKRLHAQGDVRDYTANAPATQAEQDTKIAANYEAVKRAAPADVVAEMSKVPQARWSSALLDSLAADLETRDETKSAVTATYNDAAGTFVIAGGGAADTTLTLVTPAAVPTSVLVMETLTVATRNTINDLPSTPVSPVEFRVNGVITRGITNTGVTVTVNAAAVGYNIDPGVDEVTAQYFR